jgi:hypothetical protein
MQARTIATLSVVSAALGAGLVACFDLFHSTRDILTACEIDAQAIGCGTVDTGVVDAGADAPSPPASDAGRDICQGSTSPRDQARRACAWLGACESPMGRNAFGACMFQALLAYDCAANPSHRVQGTMRDRWDCLAQVTSCADVDRCVFPQGPAICGSSGNFTACGADGSAPTDIRVECADGGAHGENCALWGQVCATNGASSTCAGGGGLGCTLSGCFGPTRTELRWCIDGGDVGLDCAGNGGQRCDGFPSAGNPRWVACLADNDAGETCAPDAAAACSSGVAISCPSGVPERIDCASILQSAAGCSAGPLSPPFDWTSPCVVTPPACTADSCSDAGTLLGCVRGAEVAVDCASLKLGPCHTVSTETGTMPRSACTRPDAGS